MTRVSKTLSIAVFGANGFIGSHLVKRLCASGHKVISFDRKSFFRITFGHFRSE